MSRSSERARNIASVFSVVLVSTLVLSTLGACEDIDGRNRNRMGNLMFRDAQFIDGAAQYQLALKEVDHPTIHYNLGQAYSKIFKPGYDRPVLLGPQDDPVCQQIPGAMDKLVDASVCVKEGDRHFPECGEAKTKPINDKIAELQSKLASAADAEKADLAEELKGKQEELRSYTCSSSARCLATKFCSLTSPQLAELAAQHFKLWIKAQPSDEEIAKEVAVASAEVDEAKKNPDDKSRAAAAQHRVEDLMLKDQTRNQMTSLWVDSDQFPKAIEYWEGLLKEQPNDISAMRNLAGLNAKSGNWRKAIEWYSKVIETTKDPETKVATYQLIGYLAWGGLNKRTLIGPDAVELADRGIGALQRAEGLQGKSLKLNGLEASLFNFRSVAQGASWAAAIDRASGADAKAPVVPPPAPPAPPTPPGAGSGSAATPAAQAGSGAAPAGSAAPASGSAAPAPAGSAAPAPAGSAAPAAPAGSSTSSGSAAAPATTNPSAPG